MHVRRMHLHLFVLVPLSHEGFVFQPFFLRDLFTHSTKNHTPIQNTPLPLSSLHSLSLLMEIQTQVSTHASCPIVLPSDATVKDLKHAVQDAWGLREGFFTLQGNAGGNYTHDEEKVCNVSGAYGEVVRAEVVRGKSLAQQILHRRGLGWREADLKRSLSVSPCDSDLLSLQLDASESDRGRMLWEQANSSRSGSIASLLEAGAEVDFVNPETHDTSLIVAAQKGHMHMVVLLVSAGANVAIRDGDGWTAEMYATLHGHSVVSAYLQNYANTPLKQSLHDTSRVALRKAFRQIGVLCVFLLSQLAWACSVVLRLLRIR